MEDKLQDEFMEFWDSKKDILGLGNYSDAVLKFFLDKIKSRDEELIKKIEEIPAKAIWADYNWGSDDCKKDVIDIIKGIDA
jgi:hypothetical protein